MRLVFLHGGLHTGGCWDQTLAAISELRPNLDVFAVDLPGRRHLEADLATLTLDDCAAAVVRQIDDSGGAGRDDGEEVVLVGHSLAGVVMARVVDRLRRQRPVQVVFVACCVPAKGRCVVDALPIALRPVVRHLTQRSPVIAPPKSLLRYAFGNHATAVQRACITDGIVPESSALLLEPVVFGFPRSVPKSWILTSRDRALPPRQQRRSIRNVGGVDRVAVIDAAHEVMITHPHELAATVLSLCEAAARR